MNSFCFPSKKYIRSLIALILVTGFVIACAPTKEPPLVNPTIIPTKTSQPQEGTAKKDPTQFSSEIIPNNAFLYIQDFEPNSSLAGLSDNQNWKIQVEGSGNHTYCANETTYYPRISIGYADWADYAIELQVKVLQPHSETAENFVALSGRVNNEKGMNYYGAMGFFQNQIAGLGFNTPYEGFGSKEFVGQSDVWYTLRLELAGEHIKYYINNQLISSTTDSKWSNGIVSFSASPNLFVCIDNLRVWSMDKEGNIVKAEKPIHIIHPNMEVITDTAAGGKNASSWGGHKTRVVATADGIFSTFLIPGKGDFDKNWLLTKRQSDGSWQVIAEEEAGREPVNLIASPDGTLHIIGWPDAVGTMWSGKPDGNKISLIKEVIPGVQQSNYPYSSVGTNSHGDICVLSSQGGNSSIGTIKWACYFLSIGEWRYTTVRTKYRYCYTYVFPGIDGSLSLVSTRDVTWKSLRYTQPPDSFDYVYNALGYWHTDNIESDPIEQLYFKEEIPTEEFPFVDLRAQQDAYIDINGIVHIIYSIIGENTNGEWQVRHLVLSSDGNMIADVLLPAEIGVFTRILQNIKGYLFLLGSSGILYPIDKDGIKVGNPIYIDLKGFTVEYSGFSIAAPRTGTPLSNKVDVVFPTNDGNKWIYFELPLPD